MSRVEPQNLDAERDVLGAMLISQRAIDVCASILTGSEFFFPSHQAIWRAILALHRRREPVDPVTVNAELQAAKQLETVGEVKTAELARSVPAAGNAAHKARLVRDAWGRREGMNALRESARRMQSGETGWLEFAERKLVLLRDRVAADREMLLSMSDMAERFLNSMESPEPSPPGVPMPFAFLERMKPGRLYVLGGYQADGKTVIAVQFLAAALDEGKRTCFASIEMSSGDLTDRIISCVGGVPYSQVQAREFSSPENQARAADAAGKVGNWKGDVVDDPRITVEKLRHYVRVGGYDLLIIDHLHRMDWKDRRELEQHVAGITNIAREFQIPVLLLAQVQRRDEFPRPSMASLRESGMIEAEASMVMFLWRHRENGLRTDDAEFIIAKHRHGKEESFPLRFDGGNVRFTESPLLRAVS